MKKLTLPVKLFLISEILIFLMIVGVVLTEIIFPLPANIEYRLIEENQKWSPRFWDNVVTVFCEIGVPLTFLLSAFGIVLSIQKNLPKKSCIKGILEIFLMFLMLLSIIVFYFLGHIPLIFGITVIIFFISFFRNISTIKNLRKQNVSVKEIIMFCIMICNFIVFGLLNFIFLLYLFGPRP